MDPNQTDIIFPLISLRESRIDKESLLINYEITDKYLFDNDFNYNLNKDNLKEMLENAKNSINSNIFKIINK